jgi:methyl-accepting chemotaxis protein
MENIKQSSAQNVASARQLENSARKLNDLGRKLKELVDRYQAEG